MVGTVELCDYTPGRNGARVAACKGHVNTRLPEGGLERGGVVSVLDPQTVSENKFFKTRPPGVLIGAIKCGICLLYTSPSPRD